MGFSIWVADDPELKNDEESSEKVEASGYPHFSTSRTAMAALREEMQSQGMGQFMPLAAFSFNNGDHVTAEDISGALSVARELPVTASDEELVDLWQSWVAFLRSALSHDGIVIY